jgi:cytochrome c oxidase cbb3-type subunit 3
MKRTVIAVAVFLFYLAAWTLAQAAEHEHKPHPHKHEKYAKVKNPIPATAKSIAAGRELFQKHCSSCHGENGKGNIGPDLTDGAWIHGNTDGEIFHVIEDGVKGTAMVGFKKELTKDMRWHIVNYIRSIGRAGK